MLTNVLFYLVNVALAVVLVRLTLRARKSARPAVKWMGVGFGALFSLVLIVVATAATRGLVRLHAPRGRPLRTDIAVERTPERIARGQHIAAGWCAACHSTNGSIPLSGSHNFSDEIGLPLGDLYAINLTPAGPVANWSDAEIFRAIREGADNRRRRLPVMSTQGVRNLSDDDIKSVIAFIRSQAPVQHETPGPRLTYLAAVMAGAGLLPFNPGMAPESIEAPAAGPTAEYGKYMVGWMGCEECHGGNLTGGGGGILPKGPTLRTVKGWTRDGFIATMRTGKTPFGKQLDSLQMPWKTLGRATDDELTAIHAYLASLQ
ncbi:MAG TPA: c-type cytochrome [Gemmatimonadaceae bacterium]|nr:c-type cytochrome [Gemmatimonadaceae bacterium]